MKSTNNNLDELNIISLDEEKDTTSVEDSSSISHNDFDIKSRREKHLKRKKRSRIFLLVFFIVVILGVGGYFGTIKYTEAKYKNNDEVAKYISSNNVNTLIDFKGSDKELLSANIPVSS
ncbi:MAG: hypothetical protein LBM02_01525, partial [Lachnospiraceae bacterium]|nr:hypothetical protein [Lachnospiraceae bacterium]